MKKNTSRGIDRFDSYSRVEKSGKRKPSQYQSFNREKLPLMCMTEMSGMGLMYRDGTRQKTLLVLLPGTFPSCI